MNITGPSLDEFKATIATLLGQPLISRASLEAAEDFLNNWSSFRSLIAQRGLSVHVDTFFLAHNFPQYKRYQVWKGASIIAVFLGIISIWFVWQVGIAALASNCRARNG